MPSVSQKQQKFMAIQLAKKLAGKPTQVKMSTKQLREFAGTKRAGLPVNKRSK